MTSRADLQPLQIGKGGLREGVILDLPQRRARRGLAEFESGLVQAFVGAS